MAQFARVSARCQLMENALPAGPLKLRQKFFVVEDHAGEHMIFCITSSGKLCLIVKAADGKNELLPLHDHFGLSAEDLITALAVSQNKDRKIHLVFTARGTSTSDRIFVTQPTDASRAAWSDSSKLRASLLSGPQWAIAVKSILLGTGNDSESRDGDFYPTIYLVIRDETTSTDDIRTLTVDKKKGSWQEQKAITMPCNPKFILSMCVADIPLYRGLVVLYRESETSSSPLQMRFVGYDPEIPHDQQVLHSIAQHVPDGASNVVSFENKDGYTDILIAGGRNLSWISAANVRDGAKNGKPPTKLMTDHSYDVKQLYVSQTVDRSALSAWFLDKASVLSYQEFATSTSSRSPPVSRSQILPLLDQESMSAGFAAMTHHKLGQKVFAVDQSGMHLKMLEQDHETALWAAPIDVMMPSSQEMIEFKSHTAQIRLSSADGRNFPETPFKLSSSGVVEVIINGKSLRLGPEPKVLKTDQSSMFTIIMVGDDVAVPILTLDNATMDKQILSKPIEIDPMRSLWKAVDQVQTGDDLRKWKTRDGKTFVKPGTSQEVLNNTADTLQKLKAVRKGMKSGNRKPPTFGQRVWGAIKWLGGKIRDGVKWVFEQVDGAWQLIVTTAEKVWKFVLENLPQVAAAIQYLLEAIADGVGWLFEKIGKHLGWDDIIDTKNMLANLTLQGMLWGVSSITAVDKECNAFFDKLKTSVRVLKASSLPSNLTKISAKDKSRIVGDPDPDGEEDDDEDDASSPSANYGFYHLQQSGQNAQLPTGDGVFERLWKRLESVWEEIKHLTTRLQTNLAKLIRNQNMTVHELIDTVGFDLLEDVLSVVQKILSVILRSLADLVGEVAGLISTPINIPVLSPLYRRITKGSDLTVLDVIALCLAIPMTLIYKAFNKGTAPSHLDKSGELKRPNAMRGEVEEMLKRLRKQSTKSIEFEAETMAGDERQQSSGITIQADDSETDRKRNEKRFVASSNKLVGAISILLPVVSSIWYWKFSWPAQLLPSQPMTPAERTYGGVAKAILWLLAFAPVLAQGLDTMDGLHKQWEDPQFLWRLVLWGIDVIPVVWGFAAATNKDYDILALVAGTIQVPFLLILQVPAFVKGNYSDFLATEEWLKAFAKITSAISGLTMGGEFVAFAAANALTTAGAVMELWRAGETGKGKTKFLTTGMSLPR